MNAVRERLIDLLAKRIVNEHRLVACQNAFVRTDRRASLGSHCAQLAGLGGSLTDEGNEYLWTDSGFLYEAFGCNGIAVIDEVAGKDRGQMEFSAASAVQLCHRSGQPMCQCADSGKAVGRVSFDKAGYLAKIEFPACRKRLEGVEHAAMLAYRGEDVKPCAPGGMDVQAVGMFM